MFLLKPLGSRPDSGSATNIIFRHLHTLDLDLVCMQSPMAMGFSKSQLPALCDGRSFCRRLAAKVRPGYVGGYPRDKRGLHLDSQEPSLQPATVSPRFFRTFLLSGSTTFLKEPGSTIRTSPQEGWKRAEDPHHGAFMCMLRKGLAKESWKESSPKREIDFRDNTVLLGQQILLQRCKKLKLQVQNMWLVKHKT